MLSFWTTFWFLDLTRPYSRTIHLDTFLTTYSPLLINCSTKIKFDQRHLRYFNFFLSSLVIPWQLYFLPNYIFFVCGLIASRRLSAPSCRSHFLKFTQDNAVRASTFWICKNIVNVSRPWSASGISACFYDDCDTRAIYDEHRIIFEAAFPREFLVEEKFRISRFLE